MKQLPLIIIISFSILLLIILIVKKLEKYVNKQNKIDRNVFLYWIGKDYKLIKILRQLIYLHSKNGEGYKVHLITPKNLNQYVKKLPQCFDNLCPAHQADFIRVTVINNYGGIWLDSDTLVLNSLDCLFNIIDEKDGFFIKQNNNILFNGVFGSKKNTPFMKKWEKNMSKILLEKQQHINWTEIGNTLLEDIKYKTPHLLQNYKIFNGLDNMYPINWDKCLDEFVKKPYDNYKNLIREFQPLIILVNSVYKYEEIESKSENEIIKSKMPLNYFINKSLEFQK